MDINDLTSGPTHSVAFTSCFILDVSSCLLALFQPESVDFSLLCNFCYLWWTQLLQWYWRNEYDIGYMFSCYNISYCISLIPYYDIVYDMCIMMYFILSYFKLWYIIQYCMMWSYIILYCISYNILYDTMMYRIIYCCIYIWLLYC